MEYQYPNCPNLISGNNNKICKVLAEQTGGMLGPIPPIRCNVTCKLNGPYCGAPMSKEKISKFAADELLMSRMFWKNGEFMKKVLNKYLTKVNINFPELEWNKIKSALEPFILSGHIEKIYLTGSIILKIKKHKDYDILLKIKSWENFSEIEKMLPVEIDGVMCDYFFTVEDTVVDRFFTILDCENKILYESSWYKLDIESIPSDITIKTSIPLEINKYIDSEMKNIIKGALNFPDVEMSNENVEEILKSKIGWAKVKNNWEKASSFYVAASSRGFIPTIKQFIGINNSDGKVVNSKIYEERKISCFGDKNNGISPCKVLKKGLSGNWMCGACGCGDNNIAALNETSGSYSKLMYPELQCPLKRKGFSNYNIEDKK